MSEVWSGTFRTQGDRMYVLRKVMTQRGGQGNSWERRHAVFIYPIITTSVKRTECLTINPPIFMFERAAIQPQVQHKSLSHVMLSTVKLEEENTFLCTASSNTIYCC